MLFKLYYKQFKLYYLPTNSRTVRTWGAYPLAPYFGGVFGGHPKYSADSKFVGLSGGISSFSWSLFSVMGSWSKCGITFARRGLWRRIFF